MRQDTPGLTVEDALVDSESADGEGDEQPAPSHEPLETPGSTSVRTSLASESGTTAPLSLGELHSEPLQGFSAYVKSMG